MENMGTDVWVKRVNIKLPFRQSYMKGQVNQYI